MELNLLGKDIQEKESTLEKLTVKNNQLKIYIKLLIDVEKSVSKFSEYVLHDFLLQSLLHETNHIVSQTMLMNMDKPSHDSPPITPSTLGAIFYTSERNNSRVSAKKENLSLEFFVENKDTKSNSYRRVSMESIGGYRRFLLSISLRFALQKLGASRLRCTQFFIDEGFTSADVANLEQIPIYLRSLLRLFDSIIITTHLDTLKHSADLHAIIQKSATLKTSSLIF